MNDLQKLFDKEYYIVDCENFTYFAKVVRAIGFEQAYDEELKIIINIPEFYRPDQNRKVYITELQRFKTFKEAQQYAKKLNELPENKKRKEKWFKNAFSQSFLEFKNTITEEDFL